MSNLAQKFLAALSCLCLTACIAGRDHVLAPNAHGFVILAGTDQPVEGAQVRYPRIEGAPTVVTADDGRFTLRGRGQRQVVLAYPIGGVYRDSAMVQVSASGLADGYASAGFVSSGAGMVDALYQLPVLMFPADASETSLHAVMRDCIHQPEQHHALHVAAYLGSINPLGPPDWMDADAVEALSEHLNRVLPHSAFGACQQAEAASAMFSAQTEVLRTLQERHRTMSLRR